MPAKRFYQVLAAVARFAYQHPAFLLILPIAIFFPLLDSRGLYEYGDANFPLNPFWVDYILPWSGAASAGADNTFIGVPRLVYHLGINALIATFHSLQVAQWLWYSAMSALGLAGAYCLARRLGAGVYAVPLAIFYAFNLWSYDRIAQGPIYLSYQALPLVVYLFLQYLARPRVATALYFACALLFVIPALQISYLAAVICLAIAIREVFLRGWPVVRDLAWLAVAVVLANAFYIFSMLADMLLNAGGNIALVNQRFNMGVFEHYSTNVGLFNTLRLQSFYYTSIARQLPLVQIGVTLLPLLLFGLLLLARRPVPRSTFYGGLVLALLGLWLVDGNALLPNFYGWFHFAVPGLRSFVEPDYYSPLFIFGAFVMLAAASRVGARAYGGLWQIAFWVMALSGTLAFLPINGPASGMPQTGQPRQYREFSIDRVQGNTLWMPPDRGVQYRWSPYTINGFTSLNSPSDAIGPTMAEWVAPGTARVQVRLANAFLDVQPRTVEALAPLMGVGTIAIAADSLSPDFIWPNPEITGSLDTLRELRAAGFLAPRNDFHDVGVHLITATTQAPLPEIGIYDEPVDVGDFDNFMWWSVLSQRRDARYTPMAADLAPGATFGGGALRSIAAPPLERRTIPIGAFADCPPLPARVKSPRAGSLSVQTYLQPRCLSFQIPNVRDVAALQAVLDAEPAGVPVMKLGLHRLRHGVEWVDPSLPAQEVPPQTASANLVVRVPPYNIATLHHVSLTWASHRPVRPVSAAPTCVTSNVTAAERNPMAYTVDATIHGRCTIVFRQSFAPIWSLMRTSGSATILGHLQIDGFANGWIVDGAGPVTFRIVNLALYAYAGGMGLTVACVLLALGLAVRSAVRRSTRSASQVRSPA